MNEVKYKVKVETWASVRLLTLFWVHNLEHKGKENQIDRSNTAHNYDARIKS